MMRSVSTFTRSSGTAIAVSALKGVMDSPCEEPPHVRDAPGDGGGRGHGGAHEMGARALPLPPFEVAIGRGRAAPARFHQVAVHSHAHRAAGFAPFESRVAKDAIEAFRLRFALDE